MGLKERRARIKQATRQGILDGARQIAQQEGWAALTIRKVADYIEYSPSIVYEYFASKEDILRALQHHGFQTLGAAMDRAQHSTDDPEQRVMHVADAYWHFAREHRDLYQVMHGLAGVAIDPGVRADAVQGVGTVAADTLIAWATATEVHLADPIASADIVWSLLHGWVSLTLIEGVYRDERRAKQLLDDALQALLRGWRAAARAA